jgi:hypothetical protein
VWEMERGKINKHCVCVCTELQRMKLHNCTPSWQLAGVTRNTGGALSSSQAPEIILIFNACRYIHMS